jgi:hypothetical protein
MERTSTPTLEHVDPLDPLEHLDAQPKGAI